MVGWSVTDLGVHVQVGLCSRGVLSYTSIFSENQGGGGLCAMGYIPRGVLFYSPNFFQKLEGVLSRGGYVRGLYVLHSVHYNCLFTQVYVQHRPKEDDVRCDLVP